MRASHSQASAEAAGITICKTKRALNEVCLSQRWQCSAVKCCAVQCSYERRGAVWCSAVRCGAVGCGALQCSAVAVRCGAEEGEYLIKLTLKLSSVNSLYNFVHQ